MWLKTYILGLDAREKSIWEMEETRSGGEFVGSSVEPCGQREEAECHGREREDIFCSGILEEHESKMPERGISSKKDKHSSCCKKSKGLLAFVCSTCVNGEQCWLSALQPCFQK